MNQLSWSKTFLLNRENIENLEEKPGVYRLSYRSADGHIYVFFIGIANTSLKQSLVKYLSKNDVSNICIKSYLENLECYFRYAIVENADLRKNVERTLYAHYSPKCNLEIPSGEIIEINFK